MLSKTKWNMELESLAQLGTIMANAVKQMLYHI